MEEVSIDDIDDPVLLLDTVLVENAQVTIDGYVDLQGGKLLYERGRTRGRWSKRLGSASWMRVPLRLEVDGVESVLVDDAEGLGTLTIESISRRPGRVDIEGVFPGTISVMTREPESIRILISRDAGRRR